MLNDTIVTTSFISGSIIQLDAIAMKMLLENLSITTIVQCRQAVFNSRFGLLETTLDLPYYDNLIDEHCDGVHGAVLSGMICQSVKILYSFVQDCVLNDTTKGLYLFYNRSTKTGRPLWEVILLALDEYMDFVKREYEFLGRSIPKDFPVYNDYNEKFRKLMQRG